MWPKISPTGQENRTFIEEARRAQIVQAAIDTIVELGFAHASFAQIAKRAGISKSVISYHFAGKDDLLEQVVTDVFRAGAAFVVPRIEAQPAASGALRAFLEADVEFIGSHAGHIQAVNEIITNLRNANGESPWDTASMEWLLDGIASLLRWGQETGEFREFSIRVMALTIHAAVSEVARQVGAYPDINLDPYARELVTLFDRATRKEQ